MPAKERVRSHDGSDFPQPLTTQPIRPHGESAPIIITQPQRLTTQLPAKHTILFEKISKDVSFLAVQPAGQKREQQLERGEVDHGASLYHGAKWSVVSVDLVVGQYQVHSEFAQVDRRGAVLEPLARACAYPQ